MNTIMNAKILKKIDADDKTLKDILHEQKYTIDYFQREFRWESSGNEFILSYMSRKDIESMSFEIAIKSESDLQIKPLHDNKTQTIC